MSDCGKALADETIEDMIRKEAFLRSQMRARNPQDYPNEDAVKDWIVCEQRVLLRIYNESIKETPIKRYY